MTTNTTTRPSLRRDVEETALTLAIKQARVTKYKRRPTKNVLGEALPMPLRFTIALNTATKKHNAAVAAYEARYGTGKAQPVVAAAKAAAKQPVGAR